MRNFKEKKHTQYFGKNDEQEHFMKQKLNELDHKTEKKRTKKFYYNYKYCFWTNSILEMFKRKSDSVHGRQAKFPDCTKYISGNFAWRPWNHNTPTNKQKKSNWKFFDLPNQTSSSSLILLRTIVLLLHDFFSFISSFRSKLVSWWIFLKYYYS